MKIEYEKCDFCGKKIEGRFTGHFKYQLLSYLTTFDTVRSDIDPPGAVDICQDCLKVLKDFAITRRGYQASNTD